MNKVLILCLFLIWLKDYGGIFFNRIVKGILDRKNDDDEDFTNNEMMYTKLTRWKENLVIIINLGNEKHDDFLRKQEVSRSMNKL